ncbi:tonB-system energizer ExbB [Pseudorhizobium endolithicum]|nr:tonB-system energizer ExbB [Pseudorhizobium endolithicum]
MSTAPDRKTVFLRASALAGLLLIAPCSAVAQEAPQPPATAPQAAPSSPVDVPQATPQPPAAGQAAQQPTLQQPDTAAEPTAPAPAAAQTVAPGSGAQPPSATPAPDQAAAPEVTAEPADPATPTRGGAEPTMERSSTDLEPLLPAGERSDIPHDLSPWGMFMAADWVVKGVMIGLAFASLVTWTVWLAKTLELAGARTRAGRTLKIIRNSATLAEAVNELGKRGGPAALMLRAAADEVRLSEAALDHADNGGVKERVASALSRIESYAGRRMSRGTGVLATIGSTAPFVGLFGTVWGIMNSFIGISESQTTNLAVVAPGIAEALLATAIGLVAAIPAVVIYNVFARSITGYRHLLADAASGVERLVSRDLDFRKVPPGSRKSPVSLVAGE